jgi:hypothetical protein
MRKPISVVSVAYDRLWPFEFSMSAFFFSMESPPSMMRRCGRMADSRSLPAANSASSIAPT